MAESVLEVNALRKEFGPLTAVDDVSFSLPEGGSLAIVGESGSGKTTIAKMIVGLERPTNGTIAACGRDRSQAARSTAERRRRGGEVQIVFQDPYTSLDPRQTVERTLDEGLRLHHGWDAERRRARADRRRPGLASGRLHEAPPGERPAARMAAPAARGHRGSVGMRGGA